MKSLQGVPVSVVPVGPAGVLGDRQYAVRDSATGAVLSAKREPQLLLASARLAGEGVVLRLPGRGDVSAASADAALSDWLGRAVRLERAEDHAFVDEAHLHLLARGELGPWDARRFRANVVVDGPADLDTLVGQRVALGGVVVDVVKRTKRCAMTTAAQPGLVKDPSVLRDLARGRDLRLGVYARVVAPGRLQVGDSVTVC